MLRDVARVLIIVMALLGGPLACLFTFVVVGAWVSTTIGPYVGDVAAILSLVLAVVSVVLGSVWLLRQLDRGLAPAPHTRG